MNLADGTLIGGRYRIVKFLGQGGFGCTYLVQHTHLNKRYAVKEFFVADICNRDGSGRVSVGTQSKVEVFDRLLKRFVKEANALVDLSGIKGIVNVVDVFEENGTAYFVMDYIEGMSVERMLQLDGPMSEQRAVQIIRETARALAEVHKRNYLHLDIKPDNIMLDFDYHPTLIDFGVSKQYDANDGHNSSTLMGHTPGFAPMEQSLSKVGQFYPATDIYALGATLYCMLTGQNPDTPSDRLNFPRPIADDLPAGTSPNVVAAIEAAMQLRVADRPQTVADFLAILDAPVQTVRMPKPEPKKPEPPRKQLPVKWIIITIAAIICVAISGKLITRSLNDKSQKVELEVAENDSLTVVELSIDTPIIESPKVVEEPKVVVEEPKVVKKTFEFVRRSEAPNLSMVVKYNNKVYYVTESEWANVPESIKKNVKKLGLVVKGDGLSFMIEPRDLTSGYLTWDEAMERYGNRLPNKEQVLVMGKQCADIRRLQKSFDLSPMKDWYWTCTERDSAFAWNVSMYSGGVHYTYKTSSLRVRAVAPVPVASAI